MKQCKGNGQSSCFNCTKNGKWSLTWTSFLYHIDNDEHMYCYKCAKELEEMNKYGNVRIDGKVYVMEEVVTDDK